MSVQPPPPDLVREFSPYYRFVIALADYLARLEPEIRFTSWWRSASENLRVGGSPESQHLFGFAFDAVSVDPDGIAEAANEIGVRAVVESDHVHVQLFAPGVLKRAGFFGPTIEV